MAEESDAQLLLALNKRLLEGDRVASAELTQILLPRLIREMQGKFPKTDHHLVSDGVTDALLDYCARPTVFDWKRGVPLDRFLAKAGWRNIANLLRGEARRKVREAVSAELTAEDVVELYPASGNPFQNEQLDAKQELEKLAHLLPNETDRKLLDLKAMGERRTERFAQIMGIAHLPIEQQRREVKKAKDRIDKVLERRKDRST